MQSDMQIESANPEATMTVRVVGDALHVSGSIIPWTEWIIPEGRALLLRRTDEGHIELCRVVTLPATDPAGYVEPLTHPQQSP